MNWGRIIVSVALGTAAAHASNPTNGGRLDAHPLPTESSNAQSVHDDWWANAQRQIARAEYCASKNKRGLQAPNRAHNLRSYFEPTGVRIHDRTDARRSELASLSLVGIGRDNALSSPGEGTVSYSGSRIEIRRLGVIEWYENSASGLEQGFTLDVHPDGTGALILELAVESATAMLGRDSIILTTDAGRRLRYDSLVTVDALGKTIPSHFEVPQPHRVRLVVEDSNAVYPLVIDPLITSVVDHMLESNQADPAGFLPAAFGGSVSNAGDVNGDGFDDVIVGAPGWDGGNFHEGAAFVFLGSASGIVGSDPTTAQAWIESNQAGAQLGTVSGAGDVNGDGFDDIIVGAHFYTDTIVDATFGSLAVDGAAFVFLGSAAGIVGTDPLTAHAWIKANKLSSDLGVSVDGIGDVNGDGFGDIVVGVPRQGIDFPSNIAPNQGSGNGGAALIFLGSAVGIVGTGFSDADSVLLPYPAGLPKASGAGLGADVSRAGDVNGDGFADLIVAAPGWNGSGAAVVFVGGVSGVVGSDPSTAHATIAGLVSKVSDAGDVNGDGFGDVVIGAPFDTPASSPAQAGKALVFLGSAAGIAATDFFGAHASLQGKMTAEWLGASVSSAGDVDGDGFDDVVVAARIYPGSLNSEGVAYVFRGSALGITAASLLEADTRLEARQSGAVILGNNAAFSVSNAGDVNGDGFADIIMGKGYWDNGQENEGAAFVWHGEPWPLNPNQPPVAIAGASQLVFDLDNSGAETITLDGSASFDPDGAIVSYAWFEGETLLGTSPVLVTDLTTIGSHVLVLTVTDDAGITRGDPVFVSVQLVDNPRAFFDSFAGGLAAWTTTGDVALSSADSFPTVPQARLGASGAVLSRSAVLPVGATGVTLDFWGKASLFSASDQLTIQVSADGGPFTTIRTITSLDSTNSYFFYGGSSNRLSVSWFPATATNVVLQFESNMSTGLFSIDDVDFRALVAPVTGNQAPVANAGADQALVDTNLDGFALVTLDGSASLDADGVIVSYEWHEGANFLGTGATLGVAFGVGDHVVTLVVTDDGGSIGGDTATITVNAGSGGSCVSDADCDDTLFCNGIEICVGGLCQAGALIDCNDGVACTDDACVEATASCSNVANDLACDNGLFCDGPETCDTFLGCLAGVTVDCNDAVACTIDSCNDVTGSCDNIASDALCDNGLFCDGAESCNAVLGCQAGVSPTCNDGVACTSDACDSISDACVNTPIVPCCGDGTCDSGEDCNTCTSDCPSSVAIAPGCGNGICESFAGENCKDCPEDCAGTRNGPFCCGDGSRGTPVPCSDPRCNANGVACSDVPSTASCCGDGVCDAVETEADCAVDCTTGCFVDADCNDGLFCNGVEICVAAICQSGAPVDCADGVGCTDDTCDDFLGACVNSTNDANCDNGLFCDGVEVCDAVFGCVAGSAINCDDFVGCTMDSCNESTNSCDNTANDAACDNGLFCDGVEICDAISGCQPGGDPCPTQACDEVGRACVLCLTNADCDDGSICNGSEACVAGVCQGGTPVSCDDGNSCTVDSCTGGLCFNDPILPCCGDTFCDPGEDACGCPQDCGAPPFAELNCTDGVDEDCDGFTDCEDADCAGDGACTACKPDGELCTTDTQCCGGRCRERKGAIICD